VAKNQQKKPTGTRKPDPTKDRSDHEAARGKKTSSSLRDLSKVHRIEDHNTQELSEELENQSDRGLALIAAALVDVNLKRAMLCRLVGFKDSDEILFYKDGSPLGSFSNRIRVARGLGVIGPELESILDIIRRIRNQFAHSPLRIDFASPLIEAEVNKLPPDTLDYRADWTSQRKRFFCAVVYAGFELEEVAAKHTNDRVPVWTK
jgi:hypothetical protein